MYGMLDISTSGMIAQRQRLDVISSNLANQNALFDANGQLNPYRRRSALFAPGNPSATTAQGRKFGVHVAKIDVDSAPVQPRVFDPDSPQAFKSGPFKGYVAETGVNSTVENVNALEAMRAYEANVMAAEATKQMMASALRLIA
jgi:flagellar basal-body rod protein FlgC